MAGAVLALVAMALAAAQFARQQLDACALMRCFGASQATITRIFLHQAWILGLCGSLAGCAVGYAMQEVLAQLAGSLFLDALPPPGWAPVWSGLAAGVAAMLGVMLPQLLRLRGVPALRILRRDPGEGGRAATIMLVLAWLPGLTVFLALVFWSARDARLGIILLGGLSGWLVAAVLLSLALGALLRRALAGAGGAWRLGLANLLRRPAISATQVAGFGLGIMAMLLLTIVRGDLLHEWQVSLPPDAPNRYIINLQPEQLASVHAFFAGEHLAQPVLHPMVRGRLAAINGQVLNAARYRDERARHLATREFNLSWAAELPPDNGIVAGRWWQVAERGQHQLSLEQGIAETLGIRLGDRLAYDIGGTRIELQVTSLRRVEWDTLRPNFFALTPPGVLEDSSVSDMAGIYLAPGQEDILNRLVRRFPNVTVIDVAAIMEQVRAIIERMAYAVQSVFAFCLLSGIAVLYAALAATRDERLREAALLRVFGASRRQVAISVLVEFMLIGLLSGALAALGASLLAWYIGGRLLHLAYAFDPALALLALASGGLLVPAAAWLGLRHIVRQPPRQTLQSA
ncbi:FtsX-like permease family protein [mine drainage metagenome]|uniref:FtsX-like permease family protein n=1 Tax=mine drainage metagenome TaxID=410659 RepID=A0A1J5R0R5_9ZZZZ